MDDKYFNARVKQHLNAGLRDVSPEVLVRLKAARMNALTKQRQTVSVFSFAGLMHAFSSAYQNNTFKSVFITLVCVISILFYLDMQAEQDINSLGELDSELLSSELPVSAYSDIGFSHWLKSTESNSNLE